MRPEMPITAALWVAMTMSGCEGPPPGGHLLRVGPLDEYARSVAPVLSERCAQGGCHGRPDRPFALFEPGVYRADPTRTHLAEGLSADETEINAARLAALAQESPTEASLALLKPLAVGAGGIYHGGGDIFLGTDDPAYRVMLRWLRTCGPPPRDGGTW